MLKIEENIKQINPEKLKKYGVTATGNKIREYINMLNFVACIPEVIGSIGIFAFL